MNLYYKNKENNELNIKEILTNHFHFSTRFIAKLKRDKKLFTCENNYVIEIQDFNYNSLSKSNKVNPTYIYEPLKENHSLIINIDFEEENDNIIATPIDLDILFEDDFMLILNKPAGIAIHPSMLHYSNTLSNGVKYYYEQHNNHYAIRPVNRLDKDTSGIVIFAKYAFIQDILSTQMANNTFVKKYYAIVEKCFSPKEGTINLPITRKENSIIERCVNKNSLKEKEQAITNYKTIKKLKDFSLVEFKLLTGRTHQIRVHSSYLGHPLLGDTLYGNKSDLINRQALHAYYIEFIHPITNKIIIIETKLPEDMNKIINKKTSH